MGQDGLSEKQFQQQVIELARRLGWHVWHVSDSRRFVGGRAFGDPLAAGLPDLIMIRPPRVVFIELKTNKGRVRPSQKETLALLDQCAGVEVYLIRPRDWEKLVAILQRD